MAEAGVPSEDGEVMEESPSNAIGTEFSAIQSRAGGYLAPYDIARKLLLSIVASVSCS